MPNPFELLGDGDGDGDVHVPAAKKAEAKQEPAAKKDVKKDGEFVGQSLPLKSRAAAAPRSPISRNPGSFRRPTRPPISQLRRRRTPAGPHLRRAGVEAAVAAAAPWLLASSRARSSAPRAATVAAVAVAAATAAVAAVAGAMATSAPRAAAISTATAATLAGEVPTARRTYRFGPSAAREGHSGSFCFPGLYSNEGMKKDGAGRGNWGKEGDTECAAAPVSTRARVGRLPVP